MGYYLLWDNIFHKLDCCHSKGINLSTPVEQLHCVLLRFLIWLFQDFNSLQRIDMVLAPNLIKKANLIFTGAIKSCLQIIGFVFNNVIQIFLKCTFHLVTCPIQVTMMTIGKMAHKLNMSMEMSLLNLFNYLNKQSSSKVGLNKIVLHVRN